MKSVFLIHPIDLTPNRYVSERSERAVFEEARDLVLSLDDCCLQKTLQPRIRRIHPKTFLGEGVVEEYRELISSFIPEEEKIGVSEDTLWDGWVVVNTSLSPVQQRNLEKVWKMRVMDRTGLILKIFAQRASTREGKLQVELASLSYQRSRLVGTWTHLERQRGGLGFVGGAGESQLEIDRRLIDKQIAQLKKDLEKIKKKSGKSKKTKKAKCHPSYCTCWLHKCRKNNAFQSSFWGRRKGGGSSFCYSGPQIKAISPKRKNESYSF